MTSDATTSLFDAARGDRAGGADSPAKELDSLTEKGGVGSIPTAASPRCPRCGGGNVYRMRKLPRGGQRWFCMDCQKSFVIYGGGKLALNPEVLEIYKVLEKKKTWVALYELAARMQLSEKAILESARELWRYLRSHSEYHRALMSRKRSGIVEFRLRKTQ